MRIIAGQWRGRRLVAPAGQGTRPTASRARETLFSMLTSRINSFTGRDVADLCAGSGALGLEALSRGARHCTFVERDSAALAAIRSNIATMDTHSAATVLPADVQRLGTAPHACDVVFIDPPYDSMDMAALVDRLIDSGWVAAGGIICVETDARTGVAPTRATQLATRKVGKAMLHLLQL
jgi:16S rRNA (guanine966-N2)-methyltransferase